MSELCINKSGSVYPVYYIEIYRGNKSLLFPES